LVSRLMCASSAAGLPMLGGWSKSMTNLGNIF
jgi:hypothetical protein